MVTDESSVACSRDPGRHFHNTPSKGALRSQPTRFCGVPRGGCTAKRS